MRAPPPSLALLALLAACVGCPSPAEYDVILRGGMIYDGSGEQPFVGDVAIADDRIVAIGDLASASAAETLDVNGLAVAPGFINMLSWSTDSLILDGHAQSEIRQGVTLQVFGEGISYGPVNETVRQFLTEQRPQPFQSGPGLPVPQ